MSTGPDLLQISLARINMERSELEEAGVIDKGIRRRQSIVELRTRH